MDTIPCKLLCVLQKNKEKLFKTKRGHHTQSLSQEKRTPNITPTKLGCK